MPFLPNTGAARFAGRRFHSSDQLGTREAPCMWSISGCTDYLLRTRTSRTSAELRRRCRDQRARTVRCL